MMAEGCIQDYATELEGDGAAPSFFLIVGPEWAFWHSGPGFCSICPEQIVSALDVHKINVHLETIVAVPSGMVRCLEGLRE